MRESHARTLLDSEPCAVLHGRLAPYLRAMRGAMRAMRADRHARSCVPLYRDTDAGSAEYLALKLLAEERLTRRADSDRVVI